MEILNTTYIVIAIIILLCFYSIYKAIQLYILTKKLQTTQNYNNTLSVLYDDVKSFKHDFENIIHTIGGFIDFNDIKGLKKFYKNLAKECKTVNNVAILNPNIINNSGIFNLLMAKYNKSKKLGVEINLDFFFDFQKMQMPIYEFSRIFGILLDNSIEAASKSAEKQINITFRDSQKNHIQLISIENTYSNKNVDTKKIFQKGVTEKDNHFGIGLWKVKKIIDKINNVNLSTTADGKYFKQKMEIYY